MKLFQPGGAGWCGEEAPGLGTRADYERWRMVVAEHLERRAVVADVSLAANDPEAVHSADFTSCVRFGHRFTFTPTRAACVAALWREYERGGLTLSERTLADAAGPDADNFEPAKVFRGHGAWNVMIHRAVKALFRLDRPPPPKP